MAGKVIFRLDDITPGMHEENFDRVLFYLRHDGIRPLLGLVPDNRDPELQVQIPSESFWERMRKMLEDGHIDIAQHGYQHLLYESPHGILNKRYSFSTLTEFAGRPYQQQFEMIQKGKRLLHERGLPTTIWIAPGHSFDHTTLQALRTSGFTRVSDGAGLYPYYWHDLLFVPQQMGQVRKVPFFGVWTICLHINAMTCNEIERIAKILPFLSAIPFPTEPQVLSGNMIHSANSVFRLIYAASRAIKRVVMS